MAEIGIVGAGVGGLQLGLLLRDSGVGATIFTERTAEQIAGGRLVNTVAHHHPTLEREARLGVRDFWPVKDFGYSGHLHSFGGPLGGLEFRGDFAEPSRAVDYRLYLPRLLEEFEGRGGRVEVGKLGAVDIDRLAARCDLLVVAAGRGAYVDLFPRRSDKSPYDEPQRLLCAALYHGVHRTEHNDVILSVAPGVGEAIALPIESMAGPVTALLLENIPGAELAGLAQLPYDTDPAFFEQTVLDALRLHHPAITRYIDPAGFRVTRPEDILQGGVVPGVRTDYAKLDGGCALAVGDVHVVVDPLVAQGANTSSYSAFVAGDAIVAALEAGRPLDETFCQQVAAARQERVQAASDWTNMMVAPPPPHLIGMVLAMAQNQAVCDEFTTNFGHPDRQWANVATPEAAAACLARHGMEMPALPG